MADQENISSQNSGTDTDSEVNDEKVKRTESLNDEVYGSLKKNEDLLKTINELKEAGNIASIYIDQRNIDRRSGGVYINRDAQINGDVVGGNQNRKFFAIAKPEETVSQILPSELEKINTVYVQVENYKEAQKILSRENLLILRGESHNGKMTTALHLLSNIHKTIIFELDPASDGKKISLAKFSNQGYVIDTYSANNAGNLTPFDIRRLSQQLKENDSHLVISIDTHTSTLRKEGLEQFSIDWDDIPSNEDMLGSHIDWYASGNLETKKKLEEYCAEDQIQLLIKLILKPRDIDYLVSILVEAMEDVIDMDIVIERFKAYIGIQVVEWFEKNTDLRDRLLLISAAVYNGASFQVVVDAEKHLFELLSKNDKNTSTTLDPFSQTRSQRLKKIGAQINQGFEETAFGRNPVEIVELNNPAIQPAILEFVWNEAIDMRSFLIEWLAFAVLNSSFGVRVRAASAVGELAKYNFGDIHTNLLNNWAKHPDFSVRAAAAIALSIPAWESRTAPLVLGLLHHWSTLNNWKLSWTATSAYGGLVGLRFPDAALKDFYHIAKTGDIRLIGVLMQSMYNLFSMHESSPEYQRKVLDAINSWTEDSNEIVGITGLYCFLFLAETTRIEADPDAKTWPALLHLIQDDKSLEQQILKLWRKSFNLKVTRSVARATMFEWLKEVEQDSRLYNNIKWLVSQIISSNNERESNRIKAYLRQWKNHSEVLQTIEKLNKDLKKEMP